MNAERFIFSRVGRFQASRVYDHSMVVSGTVSRLTRLVFFVLFYEVPGTTEDGTPPNVLHDFEEQALLKNRAGVAVQTFGFVVPPAIPPPP